MGNIETRTVISGIESNSMVSGSSSNQVSIRNGNIKINTNNIQSVEINNDKCMPCTELKQLQNQDNVVLKDLIKKYCN